MIDEVREMDIPAGDKARAVVEICIERGMLVAYFKKRRTEVTDMMFTLFDAEHGEQLYREKLKREYERRYREEGLEAGREQGIARMAESLRAAGVDEAAIEAAVAATSQPQPAP